MTSGIANCFPLHVFMVIGGLSIRPFSIKKVGSLQMMTLFIDWFHCRVSRMDKWWSHFAGVTTHRCYIQSVRDPEPEEGGPSPAERAHRSAPCHTAHAACFLTAHENESLGEEKNDEETRPALLPHFMYADNECMQDEKLHVPSSFAPKGKTISTPCPLWCFTAGLAPSNFMIGCWPERKYWGNRGKSF